ncbi:ABC transporter ATP-binding protein [Ovoidimarina sediminis]|uniref:ABC transporter ATP-binding protein n=1 Tax=Ovoidimarina sediminis TaxID=3079856 RepID=UPI00290DBE42|nr:ABC transporter ATP-binding protein [Rhodophyticola sp. MJ-SS7]MDU8941829.1 ABC transporter ATP-binding protein [Rhodophyticola sp. MJ-SS7]
MTGILTCAHVGKRRGGTPVLNDVSLSIPEGTRVALLGHNGAGKSTLIKLILGLTARDGGEISICGAAPGSNAARRATAYLPEALAFQGALTGRELLAMFARLSGLSPRETGPLLERVGLGPAADRRIATYSKGMRQRLGLAQVLLGRPRLALLDEPASGLDPVSRHELYAIIDELAASGTAVLIASHALTEVEARTDRIAILRQGRLVADDTLGNLARAAGLPIVLRVRASETAMAERIASETGGARVNGMSVEIRCPAEEKMPALHRLSGLGEAVADIDITPPGLEELYRHYSGGLT